MKLVIIGGGASGMAAASKAKRIRKDMEVTVIEGGNFVSYAECGIPYYLGGYFDDYNRLLHYPVEEFTKKRGIEIINGKTVTAVNPDEQVIVLDDGGKMKYDFLVIASGASAKAHPFGNVDNVFTIRTLDSAIKIKKNMNGSEICIIGDGVLGMELSSEMSRSGKKVTLISKHDRLFPKIDENITEDLIRDMKNRVNVVLGENVTDLKRNGEKITIKLSRQTVECDVCIYAVGIRPNTEFLKGSGIAMNEQGLVIADRNMKTNYSNIYAVGDCATSYNRITGKQEWHPLAQVANKMGRVAGSCIGGSMMEFKGALNTTVVKILDYEVGFTGIDEKIAVLNGFTPKSVTVKAGSRAAYYPGGEPIYLKIVYDEPSMRILGAQICGKDGAAWRLNTIETAIYGGMTMDDLFYNDLGYTPPFGPVWDPIVIGASLSMRD